MKKYLINGEMVEVISEAAGGFIVQHYYIDYYPDSEYDYKDEELEEQRLMLDDRKVFVEKVFDNPPIEKLAKEVMELKNEIKKLSDRKSKIHSKIVQAEKESLERLEKLKKYDELKYIEDFLDEKITHFVVVDWNGYPEIKTAKDVLEYRDGHEFKMRLLALYGDKNKPQWRLHYYSDSSEPSKTIYPFISYELAIAKLYELLTEKLYEIEQRKNNNKGHYVGDFVDIAKKYNYQLPEWIEKEALLEAENMRKREIDKLTEERDEITGKLEALYGQTKCE